MKGDVYILLGFILVLLITGAFFGFNSRNNIYGVTGYDVLQTPLQAIMTPSTVNPGGSIAVAVSGSSYYQYAYVYDKNENRLGSGIQICARSPCSGNSMFTMSISANAQLGKGYVSMYDYSTNSSGARIGWTQFDFDILQEGQTPVINLIQNDGFYDGTTNWKIGTGGATAYINKFFFSYNPLATNHGSVLYYIPSIPVLPGEMYEFSADFNFNQTGSKAYLEYENYDANGKALSLYNIWEDGGPLPLTTGWKTYTGKLIIPEGVYSIKVKIYANYKSVGVTLVDNVKLVKVQNELLIQNGDFSKGTAYWRISTGGGVASIADGGYSSSNTLATNHGPVLYYSPPIPVLPGEKYEFSADLNQISGNGKAYLEYEKYDADGKAISLYNVWANGALLPTSGWKTYTGTLTIPEGVYRIKVKIYTNYKSVGETLVDNVRMIKTS